MNLSELIEQHEQGPWKDIRTGDRYSAYSRRVLELIGDPPVIEFDAQPLIDALGRSGLKASTINKYLTAMDSMGLKVQYQKESRPQRRIFTASELAELDERVRGQAEEWNDYKAFYGLLRDTGCRGMQEYHRLDWSRVDWSGRLLNLTSYKGSSGHSTTRTVPMTDIAERALSWLHPGRELDPNRWAYFWRKVRLEGTRPYDLRHTFCTRLLERGVAPGTVMQIMGHTNLQQTLEYHHTTTTALDDARAALDGLQGSSRRPQ